PVTNLMTEGINSEIRQMLAHFVDYLKSLNVTILFTAAITLESIQSNASDEGISAMMDTWILLRDIEKDSERNRGMYILKSRGMNHSTQIREFVITDNGIVILPIHISPQGILTGSAKLQHTLNVELEDKLRLNKLKNEKTQMERKRRLMRENIAQIKDKFDIDMAEFNQNKVSEESIEAFQKKNNKEINELRTRTRSSSEKSKNRNK
ncbi:MAG: ATPase domain-containing protein, partial [Flavisolibacter sp.]